jgi:hypothetical protein
MFAQEQHGVHGVPKQASLFQLSLTPMSANAPHRLPPSSALERSREVIPGGQGGFTGWPLKTDGVPLSALTALAVRALADEGFEQGSQDLLSWMGKSQAGQFRYRSIFYTGSQAVPGSKDYISRPQACPGEFYQRSKQRAKQAECAST